MTHFNQLNRRIAILNELYVWSFLNCKDCASQPNIIHIIVDDFGWEDVSYNGAEYNTPTIDKLATEGAILSNYYVWFECTPTRTATFTGRRPSRYGLQGFLIPSSTAHVPLETPMLAEILKENNYQTYMLGKWHMGYQSWVNTPYNRGYDYFLGIFQGQASPYNSLFIMIRKFKNVIK